MTHRIFAKLILTCVGLLAVAALGVDQLVTRVSTNDLRADLERELLEKAELARTILEGEPVEQYHGDRQRCRPHCGRPRHRDPRRRHRTGRFRSRRARDGEPLHAAGVHQGVARRDRDEFPPQPHAACGLSLRCDSDPGRRLAPGVAAQGNRRAHPADPLEDPADDPASADSRDFPGSLDRAARFQPVLEHHRVLKRAGDRQFSSLAAPLCRRRAGRAGPHSFRRGRPFAVNVRAVAGRTLAFRRRHQRHRRGHSGRRPQAARHPVQSRHGADVPHRAAERRHEPGPVVAAAGFRAVRAGPGRG